MPKFAEHLECHIFHKENSLRLGMLGGSDALIKYYYDHLMDLIPYSFAPLVLFLVPYTLDLLPYYLSIANGVGGVGIFELFVFQCFV